MREILFRGKRIDNGEWVYGNLSILNGCIYHIIPLQVYIHTSGIPSCEYYDVDPLTIGQFTGLPDKNGKKIFEGDTVKVTGLCPDRDGEKRIWRQFRVGEVFYYHGAFYFDKWILCKTSEKCIEIIGNIHDKPELLEDKP